MASTAGNARTEVTVWRTVSPSRAWEAATGSPWPLAPIVVVGLLIRLAAADRLPPHVDEGNMVLGVQTVAERGWPLLPSGVLYVHGATLSYLLAPLA